MLFQKYLNPMKKIKKTKIPSGKIRFHYTDIRRILVHDLLRFPQLIDELLQNQEFINTVTGLKKFSMRIQDIIDILDNPQKDKSNISLVDIKSAEFDSKDAFTKSFIYFNKIIYKLKFLYKYENNKNLINILIK